MQIENALTTHPSVLEAAAISVPDETYGEVVGAWIVRRPASNKMSRAEIRELVAERMNPQVRPWALARIFRFFF